MRAYRASLLGGQAVVFGVTRAQARWRVIRAAREAGYDVSITERFPLYRAPEFDNIGLDYRRAWTEEHAQRMAASPPPDDGGGK